MTDGVAMLLEGVPNGTSTKYPAPLCAATLDTKHSKRGLDRRKTGRLC